MSHQGVKTEEASACLRCHRLCKNCSWLKIGYIKFKKTLIHQKILTLLKRQRSSSLFIFLPNQIFHVYYFQKKKKKNFQIRKKKCFTLWKLNYLHCKIIDRLSVRAYLLRLSVMVQFRQRGRHFLSDNLNIGKLKYKHLL